MYAICLPRPLGRGKVLPFPSLQIGNGTAELVADSRCGIFYRVGRLRSQLANGVVARHHHNGNGTYGRTDSHGNGTKFHTHCLPP